MRTNHVIAAAALAATLFLAGCSGEEDAPGTEAPLDRTSEATPSTEGQPSEPASAGESSEPPADEEPVSEAALLSISILGDEILPNAQAIDLQAGKVLLVEVVSDRAGELHVHSKPEQFLAFDEGTTNAEIVIDTPGSVEIEDHETGAVVALVEVR
jgi:PBP1b-binding outer membrane lipoprotein LpoB